MCVITYRWWKSLGWRCVPRVSSKKGHPRSRHIRQGFFLLSIAVMKFQTGDIWTNGIGVFSPNREYRPRENVTFLENGTKVYALNPKSFVFVREKSAGDPEVDIVRTINIPYVVSSARRRTTSLWLGAAGFWVGCTLVTESARRSVGSVTLPNAAGPSV